MATLLSALDNFDANTWKMFLFYVQGESFVKCYRQGKNFLQNWVKIQGAGITAKSLKEFEPMVQIPLGGCDKTGGVSKMCGRLCVACSSPLLTSHQCVTSIPEPTIFSKMGAYSKEQGIMHLSLHWEASTPCSFPGLHHSYRSNVLFLFPWPSSHWTISPILPIYHCGLVLFFLIICTSAASECCSLRAKIRSWNNGEVSARSQLSSNLTLSCSLSGQADSQGQWKENKKKKQS